MFVRMWASRPRLAQNSGPWGESALSSERKKVSRAKEPEIPITPMLDMAFQLLTFFVLTYHAMPTEGSIGMSFIPAQPATAMSRVR